jgi:predicted nucleotidyltransferase
MVKQSVAIKIARDYLKAVRETGVNVHRAYLFGSFALNRQHEWSDIDIALIADDFVGIAALDKDRFRRLHLLPEFIAIETHTFPTQRLEEGDPFIKEIVKTGIEIN